MRSGSSLIEALVALVLLEFGMLALAATSAVAARDLGAAHRRVRARALATDRVERLRTTACATAESGTAVVAGGLTESWRVEASGPRRAITDSVAFLLPRGRVSSVVVRAWVLCPWTPKPPPLPPPLPPPAPPPS